MTRLINADDMIKSLMDMTFYDEEGHVIDDYEDRLAIVKSFVDPVQTVDAQPVRHGRWIEDGSFKYKHGGRNSEAKELFGTEWRTMRRIKCSLCNKITLVDDTILYEYCPHCGAKMDGEQEKQNESI